MSASQPIFAVRAGQREFERGVRKYRVCGLLARRQYGKTTIASRISLRKMMKIAGHTVIFGSVKLDLGREIVRKEADALQKAFQINAAVAEAANLKLQLADADKAKPLILPSFMRPRGWSSASTIPTPSIPGQRSSP